jgi:hypothetical protein
MGGVVPWSVFLMDGDVGVEECEGGVERSLEDGGCPELKPRAQEPRRLEPDKPSGCLTVPSSAHSPLWAARL